MNNPFDGLDPYECRNLIGHLQDAGRADEVHRVLAMETVERGKAWFELCERRGELRGYLADVDRAWRLAERLPGQECMQAGDCGRQVRYALLAATMSGRALNISGPLLVALVRNDLWSSDQAMAYLRQMPDPGMRALALQRLAPYLPQPAVREAIVLAGRGASQWQMDNALIGLLPRQAELGEAAAALKAALLVEDGPTCAKCLAGVLRHSSSALRAKAEQDVHQVSNPERRTLLCGLGEFEATAAARSGRCRAFGHQHPRTPRQSRARCGGNRGIFQRTRPARHAPRNPCRRRRLDG
jgi:hypothetical protein